MTTTIHVTPAVDVIRHDFSEECICGPDVKMIRGGVLVTHHSLAGGRSEYVSASRTHP